MVKIAITVVCTVLFSACSTLPDWVKAPQFSILGSTSELGNYSFDWHLSGARQVAPLQVFDNGKKIWLQFMPEQVVPAIFQSTAHGDRPLRYKRDGDYLILDGVWPKLSFRGGALIAYAERGAKMTSSSVEEAVQPVLAEAVPAPVDLPSQTATIIEVSPEGAGAAGISSTEDIRSLISPSFLSLLSTPRVLAYNVTMQDQNLRRALNRWATQASWTFGPEHWTVDVDIPISGEAMFGDSFEDSVQDLLAATELAERPLRPCFYSNRVLRVVAYSQSCDRTAGVRES